MVVALEQAARVPGEEIMNLVEGVLATSESTEQLAKEAREMAEWARRAGAHERRELTKGFKKAKRAHLLIHAMARMEPEDAAAFMQNYFEAGGELITVAEWLRDAGEAARKRNKKLAPRPCPSPSRRPNPISALSASPIFSTTSLTPSLAASIQWWMPS